MSYTTYIVKKQRERDIFEKIFGDILKMSYICSELK